MGQNGKLLQSLHEQARMGGFTLQVLLEKLPEGKFAEELGKELAQYKADEQESAKRLREIGLSPDDLSAFAKKRTEWMMKWEMLQDDSPSHLAEMLILGSNMGVIQSIRDLHEYDGADEKHLKFAEKMLRQQEENIKHWKSFL